LESAKAKSPKTHYTLLPTRAVVINFDEDFASAEKLYGLPGVRRAVIAYWAEALADLRQRNAKSVFARYHSYDAVSQLFEYKRATQNLLVADLFDLMVGGLAFKGFFDARNF
jgi:hypothetical protein